MLTLYKNNSNIYYSFFLLDVLLKFIDAIKVVDNQFILFVSKEHLLKISFFLKKHTYSQYKSVVDICCVDFPQKMQRFELNYNFLSVKYNHRICLKTFIDEFDGLTSLNSLFNSTVWLEREVWDLFGVFFINHFDLRRILTDYGFNGFPFRKDFPLSGFLELRYDDKSKQIVYEPIEITQEFRFFDFISPWEQTK